MDVRGNHVVCRYFRFSAFSYLADLSSVCVILDAIIHMFRYSLPTEGVLYSINFTNWQRYMAITIKTASEIQKMRAAGQAAAQVLEMITPLVKAGVSTEELDKICHRYITEDLACIPAPLHYKGFPKSICTSLNHQVCHGIPDQRKLKDGDILNIDVTVIKEGYHGDTSKMFMVGKPALLAQRLCDKCYEAMRIGIAEVRPGKHLGDIGYNIQKFVERHRYSVVEDYCGHGIGTEFHEQPQVLHYGKPGTGTEIVAGMTFTIEPMINAGKKETRLMPDQWTAVTKDHSLSAQWEHTILVTESGHEILTLRSDEVP